MNNRRKFFLNGLLLTLVSLFVRSIGIAFNSFVTRTIGAEGIGLFTLIGTLYAFAVTFASAGISLTVTRLVSSLIGEKREREVRSVLSSSVRYALIFGTVSSLVLFFGAEYFASAVLSDARAKTPLQILSLTLVPIALSSVYSGYFIGIKKVAKNASAQIVCQAFKIGVTSLLVLLFSDGSAEGGTVILCIGAFVCEISVFLTLFLEYLIDKKRRSLEKRKSIGAFSTVSKTALPIAVSAYVRSALLTLEHALIPKSLAKRGESKENALSAYGTLHGMALPVLIYPMAPLSSFAGLLVPEFSESLARGEERRMVRLANEALNTTLVYAIFSSFCLAFFSEEIGYVLYGSYEAGYYVSVMCPVIPIMYLDHVTDSVLKGIGEQVYSMWVNITDSLLSVLLVWLIIPKMGIIGYALVIVIMEGYNFILSAKRLYKRIKFKIFALRSVLFPIISSLVSIFLSKSLFEISGATSHPVWLFLRIIFAACVFIGAELLLRMTLDRFKTKEKVM